MILEIADDVLERTNLTEADLRMVLAVVLFKEEKLTLAQAAKLAGMHQFQFQKELAKRKISLHYDVEDFERDMATLKIPLR